MPPFFLPSFHFLIMFMVISGFDWRSDLATFHKEIIHHPYGLFCTHDGSSLNRTFNERRGKKGKQGRLLWPGEIFDYAKFLSALCADDR